jgi:RNA polymerase sigma factor (sigma-70 family)
MMVETEIIYTNEELILRYQAGEYGLLDKLTEQNINAIKFIANKYMTYHCTLSFDDLVSVAWDGFYNAVCRYRSDIPNAASFATYAFMYMKYAILNAINRERKRSDKELSLELPTSREDETIGDTLEDEEAQRYFHRIEIMDLRRELNQVMKENLSLKERQILKAHHGWGDDVLWQFTDIARVLEGDPERWPVIYRLYWKSLKRLARSPWGIEIRKEKLAEANPYTRGVETWTLDHERLQTVVL